VIEHLRNSQADVFGITSVSPQLPLATIIARTIRKFRPNAKIILGGTHVTLTNAAYKTEKKKGVEGRATRAMRILEKNFDILVAGDGEESIFEAMRSDAPKLIDADDQKSSLFLNNERLNKLPFPARHLVDIESYRYSIENVRATSLIAQLGCPFGCGFCGGRQSPALRHIRTRTSDHIVKEMVHLYKTYGFQGFMFYDDELNVNPKMVELMNLITSTQQDLGIQWRLRGFIKSQLFTDKQAKVMYRAGFRLILVGFESGSERILANINKHATRDENSRCMDIARRAGLKIKALMSIGHPGESSETIQETQDWLLKVKPDDFDISIITCYPGTPYYDEAIPHEKKQGVWVYTYNGQGDGRGNKLYQIEIDYTKIADYYKGNPKDGYKAYVYTDALTSEELVLLRGKVEATVRERLKIPYPSSAPAILYEHSMGQNSIPPFILKTSLQKICV
jgi:anaerobic magnesium-protoporphyrin IX monomethyl ester cyclase